MTMTSDRAPASEAGRCVAPHLRCLRLCGFHRPPRAAPRPLRRAHAAYRLLALSACCLYLAQECVYAYQERADMDKLSRVMFLLLCHVTSLAKQLVFRAQASRIDALVAAFDDAEFAVGGAAGAAARRDTARRARRLQRGYSGCAVVTCVLWLVPPLHGYLRARPVEFPFWLPAAPTHPLAFSCALLYSFYVATLVGIANTTMDAFVGAVLDQCTTQVRILRSNIETLPARTRAACRETGERAERAEMRLFRECLLHYDKISQMKSELEDIFGTAILIQFAIGGWILCMAAYKLVSLSVLSVEFASMSLFIACILTELFVYCYYGNELTHESARLLDSLYACGWERGGGAGGGEGGSRALRRAVLVAGERARRPLRSAAARLVPLQLDTFLKIIKSSYTFYAVLRQTK